MHTGQRSNFADARKAAGPVLRLHPQMQVETLAEAQALPAFSSCCSRSGCQGQPEGQGVAPVADISDMQRRCHELRLLDYCRSPCMQPKRYYFNDSADHPDAHVRTCGALRCRIQGILSQAPAE